MNESLKRPPLRMLAVIGSPKIAEKASRLLEASRLPIHYQLRGQGTATSETMDVLGLGGTTKILTLSVVPKAHAGKMLDRLTQELRLSRPGTGIAFTTALNGISSPAMKILDENIRKELHNSMETDMKQMTAASVHSLIVAVVNQGFSEEVMDAARAVGARGGTVLHARQMGAEEAMHFWGITIQEEKEFVLILAKNESKMAIMKAVSEKCGMHSEARGIVFSSPIDMIAGLEA